MQASDALAGDKPSDTNEPPIGLLRQGSPARRAASGRARKFPFLFLDKGFILKGLSIVSSQEILEGIVKRVVLIWVLVFVVTGVFCGSVQAQWLPWNMSIDSSFRVGYLFGRQDFRFDNPEANPYGRIRLEFDPSMPVFEGVFEFSPMQMFSVRLAGTLGARGEELSATRPLGAGPVPSYGMWKVAPDVKWWETAGLFHLWKGAGYRFSLVGGYRQEFWRYTGEPANMDAAASYREEFTSHIPFIAMQTAIFYPWWKARFEVLGSPLMSKRVQSDLYDNAGGYSSFEGWADNGGLIEMLVEGTVAVSSRMRLGIFSRYTFVELDGEATHTTGGGSDPQQMYVGENFGTFGLNLSMIF